MSTRLKLWLQGLFLGLRSERYPARSEPVPDYTELAFELALAEDISAVLPQVLSSFQAQMNSSLDEDEQGRLFVLISRPATSESYLHHADSRPAKQMIQGLHRTFTVNQPPQENPITLRYKETRCQVIASKLFEDPQTTVWQLLVFQQQLPALERLKWKTARFETALAQGISSWYQVADQVQSAIEAERSAFAAELHDSLAQVLGYLRIKSARLDKLCNKADYRELKPITADIAAYTHCAYRQTRELITSSRLTMQSQNLSQGVIDSIREFEQQSAIVFELDNRLQINILSAQQALQILYIVRESLSNIVRHSHASHARVSLRLKQPDLLSVVIEDNGTGISSEAGRSDSFGLQIMAERAERIGAELSISNRIGGGTCIELTLDIGEQS